MVFKAKRKEVELETDSPRQLPIYKINNKWYFRDVRLEEYRNIKNPYDRISFDAYPVLQVPTDADRKKKLW